MMERHLVSLVLFLSLAGCAHSTSLKKGDEAAAANNWTAALDAYQEALQSKPSSSSAREAVDHAKPLAVALELQNAQLALDLSNYEEAIQHLDYVRKVDPGNEEEKQLRDDAKKRMGQELAGKLEYELDAIAIYDLVERARKLFPDLVEIPKTLEALRTRIEKDAETLVSQKKYQEAIQAVKLVSEHEPNLKVHVQTLEQTYLTAWAEDFAARGKTADAKGQQGLATVLYARAYEIAGRPDDLQRSRTAARALVKKTQLTTYLETKGDGGRPSQIRVATQTTLDTMVGVAKGGKTTHDLGIEVNVKTPRCTETSTTEPKTKDYISGQIKVPNPDFGTLTTQRDAAQATLDRAEADLARVRPDAVAAKAALLAFDEKLAKAKSERDSSKSKADSARQQLDGANKRKSDLDAKLAGLESANGPEWDIKATKTEIVQAEKVIPQWEEAFREKQSVYEQANMRYDDIATDRAPAADAAERLAGSEKAAVQQVDEARTAVKTFEAKLATTSPTLLQDVHETLEYKVYSWTRTCSAPVSMYLRPSFKTELTKSYSFDPKQMTTDTSSIGHEKAAVQEDPKAYPKTDDQLIADADVEIKKKISETVLAMVDAHFQGRVADAAQRLESDPDAATETLVSLYIGAKARMDDAAQAVLKGHLDKTYGLSKLDLLKAD
jgi:tetratricopeptide (TPR) repeat protein